MTSSPSPMPVLFAGTPEFAQVALQRLLDAGHPVPLVLTQPDRPAGRGMKLQASPVKQCALAHGIPVVQPRSLRLDGKYPEEAAAAQAAIAQALRDSGAQALVVAAYGLILPQWVLDAPPLGCLNIHASLLPRWRGAAPIHRAIEAGDAQTGITIMQMDAGLDTGAMLMRQAEPITQDDTTASLHDRLAALGGALIVDTLAQAQAGRLPPATPQPEQGVNYAHKIDKAESLLDWRRSAPELARQVRAFTPFPGASTQLGADTIKIWACEVDGHENNSYQPLTGKGLGQILYANENGIGVCCGGATVLRLTLLQRAGGKRLPVAQFLRGFAVAPGQVLGAAPQP